MKLLQPLRDVGGVEGSFLVGRDGYVFERDLAAFIPDDVLASVAQRAQRLFEASSDGGEPVDEALLQFSGAVLLLRPCEVGYLGVLGQPRMNVEAARIAANMLRRRLLAPSKRDPLSSDQGMAGLTPPPVPVFPSSKVPASARLTSAKPTPTTPSRKAGPAAPATAKAAPPKPGKPKPKIWG